MNDWAKWVANAALILAIASFGWVLTVSKQITVLEQKSVRDESQDNQLRKQWRMLSRAERYINEERFERGSNVIDLGGDG